MNLLRRFFAQSQRPTRINVDADHEDLVEVSIVGEASYQPALRRIAGPKTPDGVSVAVSVRLGTEPWNEYDKNAVVATIDGETVGYLSRDAAIGFHKYLASQGQGNAAREGRAALDGIEGEIMGGFKRPGETGHYGVVIFLPQSIADCLK